MWLFPCRVTTAIPLHLNSRSFHERTRGSRAVTAGPSSYCPYFSGQFSMPLVPGKICVSPISNDIGLRRSTWDLGHVLAYFP